MRSTYERLTLVRIYLDYICYFVTINNIKTKTMCVVCILTYEFKMKIHLKRTLILTVPFGKPCSYSVQSFRLCVGVVDIMCGSKAYTFAAGRKLVISSHSSFVIAFVLRNSPKHISLIDVLSLFSVLNLGFECLTIHESG